MAKSASCKEAKILFDFIVKRVQGKISSWEGDVAQSEEQKCTQDLLNLLAPDFFLFCHILYIKCE